MPRRAATLLAALALALLLALGRPAASRAADTSRPNIVVLMTDDQTLESIRVMQKTNALIGAQGATFANSIVSFSLCAPSRATFLTGQYAHNHGVVSNEAATGGGYYQLDPSNTLPVWLRRSGYYTALVGRYVNDFGTRGDGTTIPPGWGEWHSTLSGTNYRDPVLSDNGQITVHPGYQTDVYAQLASDVIGRAAASPKPFFLWVTFGAPHAGPPVDPGDPPEPLTPSPAPQYANAFADEPLATPPSFDEPDYSDKPIRRPRLTVGDIQTITTNYRQTLETLLSVDDAVETIIATLARTNTLDKTLVIFTSDNGYFFGEHRIRYTKMFLYEPSIDVPLLMRGPGVPLGAHVNQLVANIDLAPTIVDVARAHPERAMDGRSLMPLLRDPSTPWDRRILLEGVPFLQPLGLRAPRDAYFRWSGGKEELYDLNADPYELNNLIAGSPTLGGPFASTVQELAVCGGATCQDSGAIPASTADPVLTGTARVGRRLRVTAGDWTGSPAPSIVGYHWQRCGGAAGCVDVPGVNRHVYLLRAADVGYHLRAIVTAANDYGSTSSYSLPTGSVKPPKQPAGR